jgi:hypothetical protein
MNDTNFVKIVREGDWFGNSTLSAEEIFHKAGQTCAGSTRKTLYGSPQEITA